MTIKRIEARPYSRRINLTDSKLCPKCKQVKSIEEFAKGRCRPGGIDSYCKPCKKSNNKLYYNSVVKKKYAVFYREAKIKEDVIAFKMNDLVNRCKLRAEKRGIPFNLDLSYILSVTGTHCPVFRVPFDFLGTVKNHDYSPSLDRLIPKLGYVKGNVSVICWKANRMKVNATFNEIKALGDWIHQLESGFSIEELVIKKEVEEKYLLQRA